MRICQGLCLLTDPSVGTRVREHDAQALAIAAGEWLRAEPRRRAARDAGRAVAARFGIDALVDRIAALYEELRPAR